MSCGSNEEHSTAYITEIKSENKSVNQRDASPSDEPSPAIFNLTVDCFHEIFDWLPLNDIISIGQTCKRLQRVAGDFFQTNYAVKMGRVTDGIYVSLLQSNIFSQYIRKVSISGDRLNLYHYVGDNCSNSIKHFRVCCVLPNGGFEYVKKILNSVELLEMSDCIVNGDFYENCLKYCPNLKTICVTRSDRMRDKSIIIGSGNDWLLRKYPKLENLELTDSYKLESNELKIFFTQNPNVRTFSTDSRTLWENRHAFIGADIKLDKLAIDIYQMKTIDTNNQPICMVDSIHNLLGQLYEKGIYKWLDLYIFFIDEHNKNKLLSLNAIEMIMGDIVRIKHPLHELKALSVWSGDDIMNDDSLRSKLPKLKRLYLSNATCDSILHFIQHWPQLNEIRITRLHEGIYLKTLNLPILNRRREKLPDARKVKIFVKDDLYLVTKWAMNSAEFSMIELRRASSVDWEELSTKSKYFKSI